MRRIATAIREAYLTAVLLLSMVHSVSAQVMPTYPIIFDDFDYRNESELNLPIEWFGLKGQPLGHQQAWYKGNWDQLEFAKTSHITFDRPGSIRLETEEGHFYFWKSGVLPPMLMSGFVFQKGTWAARLRFDDISLGTVTESPLSMAFWTVSSTVACVEDPRRNECGLEAQKWSEFNHEWNNSFNEIYKQFLANGGVVDGNGNQTSAFYMRSPAKRLDVDLSCRHLADGVDERIEEPSTCMSWFVSNENPDRFVDLLIQYNGDRLIFEAVAWQRFLPSGSLQRVTMKKAIHLGRLAQPMATRFSLLGRTRDSCEGLQLSELSCWKQDAQVGFSIDWFFYSPTTEIELMDVVRNVDWLRQRNLTRVNTTSTSVNAPQRQNRLRAILEDPSTNDAREWVIVPSQRSTLYERIQINWSFRSRVTTLEPWSGWSRAVRGGYTYVPPVDTQSVYQVSVRASVSDWHDSNNTTTVEGCKTGRTYSIGPCSWQPREFLLGENTFH